MKLSPGSPFSPCSPGNPGTPLSPWKRDKEAVGTAPLVGHLKIICVAWPWNIHTVPELASHVFPLVASRVTNMTMSKARGLHMFIWFFWSHACMCIEAWDSCGMVNALLSRPAQSAHHYCSLQMTFCCHFCYSWEFIFLLAFPFCIYFPAVLDPELPEWINKVSFYLSVYLLFIY